MPDWLSHVIIGLIICEIFNLKPKSLVIFVALLPDFVTKISYLRLFFDIQNLNQYLFIAHTMIGALLITMIILPFFRYPELKVFKLVIIGWISHIFADYLFNFAFEPQYLPFFPFFWQKINIGIIWADYYYVITITSIMIYLIIKLARQKLQLFDS